ncbi:hypothetical protein COU37_02110 [Candidatus Micrarchaeota archaeon CG10_big_fil_rev_8_21_14_0_10_45_29]|nr:MAG: hypothetical protein COU37_02110 [Candidatus Micrarchaeota archaeon CG10_big_fil_rev_8_21_14_0_10_45_29]
MDINDAWKSICKILLSREIGELRQYGDYLSEYVEKPSMKTSSISGKSVAVSSSAYSKGAKFIAHDEMAQYEKIPHSVKLGINQIKDMDSILESISGKICYSGNMVVGNSREVENSDTCEDAQYVSSSIRVFTSKFVAYSSDVRLSESIFGCDKVPDSKFLICSCHTHRSVRTMECLRVFLSSDCYYCCNLEDCSDCIFTFNQRNKRNMIGNVQLEKPEYLKLKKKLIAEFADTLESKKFIPKIADIMADSYEK